MLTPEQCSEKTTTEGNTELWPKGRLIPYPGVLRIHVVQVHPPAPIEDIYVAYREWVLGINTSAYRADHLPDTDEDTAENNAGEGLEDE